MFLFIDTLEELSIVIITLYHCLHSEAEAFLGAEQPVCLVSFPAWVIGSGALAEETALRGLLLSRFTGTALPCSGTYLVCKWYSAC